MEIINQYRWKAILLKESFNEMQPREVGKLPKALSWQQIKGVVKATLFRVVYIIWK